MKLMNRSRLLKSFLQVIIFVILFQSTQVLAWGGRGHDVICRSAIYLVKNKNLQNFLKTRPHTMGHLCNLPDTYWKTLAKEIRKQGDPAHYIDPEILGIAIDKIPFDLKEISKNYNGKENQFEKDKKIFNVIDDLGSVWWRVDQFHRRISAFGSQFKNSNFPKNNSEEQNQDLPFNKLVYQMMTEMGLVGHFIGDLGQPFHNTADHDGYAAGHGGIHAYYEEGIIAQFDDNLDAKALSAARKIKKFPFMNSESIFEKMKGLSALSVQGVAELYKLDVISKPSSVEKTPEGMKKRTPAVRKPASEVFQKFEKQIVKDLSRSIYVLAWFWDELYEKAGQPDLKPYKSYQYPFTVDFIPLDYIPESQP